MFPLLSFGKARQEQLLQLVESSSDALKRETHWFERTDWKQTPPLVVVRGHFPRVITPQVDLPSGKFRPQ